VHSLKWVLGRARPWDVLDGGELPFTHWYEFGAHYVTDGVYRGSFPSGHVAAAFMLMAVAYALAADPLLTRRWRVAGWILGAFVLAFAGAMGVANGMSRSHWVSDGLGSVALAWPVLHVLYFHVLRVPAQRKLAAMGTHVARPYWEARLCAWGFCALLGLMAIALGIRALVEPHPAAWGWLIAVGAVVTAWCAPRFRAAYRAAMPPAVPEAAE